MSEACCIAPLICAGVAATKCVGCVDTGNLGAHIKFGQYSGSLKPGCFCVLWPFHSVTMVSMKMQQMECCSDCKTKDNVTLTVKTAVQYRIQADELEVAVFHVADPRSMIQAQIDDILRSTLPTMDLDEAYSAKDKMVSSIQNAVSQAMEPYGHHIAAVLITDLSPEPSVMRAMNEINASRRLREAAIEKGEAEKILAVKKAEADAEAKHLSGKGVAAMRQAITSGFKNSVQEMQDCGLDPQASIHMMLVTQYMDTLKDFAQNGGTAIMVPHGPGAIKDIEAQVRDGFVTADHMKRQ